MFQIYERQSETFSGDAFWMISHPINSLCEIESILYICESSTSEPLAQINEDLKKKNEDLQYVINNQQNNTEQKNALITELQEKIKTLGKEIKNKEYKLQSKEKEMLAIKERLSLMASKERKQKSNPFERLANW